MRVLIAVCCVFAVASANWGGQGGQQGGPTGGYRGPLHIPQIGPDGVPKEPAAVIAARSNHLAAFGGPQPQANQWDQQPQQNQWNQQPQQNQWNQQPQQNQWNQQPQQNQWNPPPQQNQWNPPPQQNQWNPPPQQNQWGHRPQPWAKIDANGMPMDAPDVAAARQAHLAAFSDVASRHNSVAAAYPSAPAGHWG